jgi:hypothetical protein
VGDFKMRKGVNLATFAPGQTREPGDLHRVHYRVQQYGSQTELHRDIEMGGVEGADRIFPVVLVYDQALLGGSEGHYGQQLPASEAERSQVIQKAYVLDAEML